MAKGGGSSRVGKRPAKGDTYRRLVDAAIETLCHDGLRGRQRSGDRPSGRLQSGARLLSLRFSCEPVARRAGRDQRPTNGSLPWRRRHSGKPERPGGVAADMPTAKISTRGHITVLSEMIAGASSTPGLGEEVAARIEPWIDFTETTLRRFVDSTPMGQLVPIRDAAFAIVALYLRRRDAHSPR